MTIPQTVHIVLGAGSGTRYGADRPKQFLMLRDRPVLAYSVQTVLDWQSDSAVVVVLPAAEFGYWRDFMEGYIPSGARLSYVAGGASRTESVRCGLDSELCQSLAPELVSVHDGARPLLTHKLLDDLARALVAVSCPGDRPAGAVPAVPVTDSLCAAQEVYRPVDRSAYMAVQTPQMFSYTLLRQAYAALSGMSYTDDASLLTAYCDRLGLPGVRVVPGDTRNIKITNPGDLAVVEAIIRGTD